MPTEQRQRIIKDYDCVLLNYTKEQYEEITNEKLVTNSAIIQVGYTRGMAEWQAFLDRNSDRYLSGNITSPYFFFVLTYLESWLPGEDCLPADQILMECLFVIKEFNREILTVFKPHQKTDMKKFQEILDTVGYQNYVISYEHPMILMRKAKFTFSYTSSSVLLDAYYQGDITVEYAHYGSKFFEFNQEQSVYLEGVDFFIHRDPKKLKTVFMNLIRNDIKIQRNEKRIRRDFPVMTHEEVKEKFSWLL